MARSTGYVRAREGDTSGSAWGFGGPRLSAPIQPSNQSVVSNLFLHLAGFGSHPSDPAVALSADNPLERTAVVERTSAATIGVLDSNESSLAKGHGWIVAVDGWLADSANAAESLLAQLAAHPADKLRLDLDGELSAVAHHSPSGTTLAIRDHAGLRPLYIGECTDGGWIVASSFPIALAAGLVPATPDLNALRHLLVVDGVGPHSSPYKYIRSAPSGSVVHLSPGQPAQSNHWWSPRRGRSNAADLRHAVERAIELRIALAAHVDVEVSGGLDSSSIAGVAASSHLRDRLTIVGLTGAEGPADERSYQAAVERKTGLPAVWVPLAETAPDAAQQAADLRSLPAYPNGWMWNELYRQRSGSTEVTLSGTGGDELFGRLPADVLRALTSRNAAVYLRDGARGRRHIRSAAGVVKSHLVRRARVAPPWVVGPPLPRRQGEHTTRRWLLTGSRASIGQEFDRPVLAPLGIDRQHPFLDRTVVEVGLALPATARADPSDWRSLQRSVFADVLPEEVLSRRTKAHFNSLYFTHVWANRDLLVAPAATSLGLVDPNQTKSLSLLLNDEASGRILQQLWNLIATESFLRSAALNPL